MFLLKSIVFQKKRVQFCSVARFSSSGSLRRFPKEKIYRFVLLLDTPRQKTSVMSGKGERRN